MRHTLSRWIFALCIGLPGAGCHEETQAVPATEQIPQQFEQPTVGVSAGEATSGRFRMRFTLGGAVPPAKGEAFTINTPNASAGGEAQ